MIQCDHKTLAEKHLTDGILDYFQEPGVVSRQ